DRATLVSTLRDALEVPIVRMLVDRNADAIAIGYSIDVFVGAGGTAGRELLYVRAKDGKPARIQVNDLAGWIALPGAGNFSPIAFVRGHYGDPDTISSTSRRHTVALGLYGSSVAVFRQATEDGPGWAPFLAGAAAAGIVIGCVFGAVQVVPI